MPVPALASMAKDAGVSLADAERYWDEAKASAAEQGRAEDFAYIMGIVKKRMGMKEWDYPMDTHYQESPVPEEITTTAGLGTNQIARTSPDQDLPHVCVSCGYGSSNAEGGTCPKCGGRMAEKAKWIRELVRRVEDGESASKVLSSILQ